MRFLESFCSNTRLMGVMMLYIEWKNDNDKIISHLFMLDSEGLGVADFAYINELSRKEMDSLYMQRSGGLGGVLVEMTEEEAVFLAASYIEKTKNYNKDFPEEFSEELLEFYLAKKPNNIQMSDIMDMICKKIETENEFINYMMMRLVSRDTEALFYYSGDENVSKEHITKINGTLLYNEIKKKSEDRFVCSCIFEDIDGYYEATIAVNIDRKIEEDDGLAYDETIENFALRSFLVLEKKEISDYMVFNLISKEESVTVYSINEDVDSSALEYRVFNLYPMIQEAKFETGILYTHFYLDNTHLESDVYIINNDIIFLIFINKNKLFLATYDEEGSDFIENMVEIGFEGLIEKDSKYEFEQNVLFDFIESGNEDFEDYLE